MLGWVWGSRGLYLCAFFCSHFIFPCPLCLLGPLTLRVLWGIYQCFSWNPQDQSINQLSKNHSLRSDGSLVYRYASLVLILSCSLPMPVLQLFQIPPSSLLKAMLPICHGPLHVEIFPDLSDERGQLTRCSFVPHEWPCSPKVWVMFSDLLMPVILMS